VAGISFSLQPVLSYKENLVDLLERQLAQLFARRKAVEMVLVSLHQERQQVHRRLVAERQGVLKLGTLWQHQVYLDWLGERIDAQEKRLTRLDEQVDEKRKELLTAMQEKRMLEKLKEKARKRFLVELERREADLHDEMATVRFAAERARGDR